MRIAILYVFVLLVASCGVKDNPPTASAPVEENLSTDLSTSTNLVDNIQLVDLENNPINLNDYRGKTVFLNFWATWCKPCIQEMPSIERTQKELETENFIFLLASDEPIERIERFQSIQDFNLTFVKLKMPFPDIGIYSIPTTMVIDPQGKITLNHVGAMEWDTPENLESLRTTSL